MGDSLTTESFDLELDSPERRFNARLRPSSSAATLRTKIIETDRVTIERAFDQFEDDDGILRAAQAIVGARRRFVIGSGRSFAYATLLSSDLSLGLSQVLLVDEVVVRSLDVLRDVRPTDILVVYSFRRYFQRTVVVAKEFVEAGGRIVLITDAAGSELASLTDLIVLVPTGSASYTDSPSSVAAATHLLAAIATASAKGARRRIAEINRLQGLLGTLAP